MNNNNSDSGDVHKRSISTGNKDYLDMKTGFRKSFFIRFLVSASLIVLFSQQAFAYRIVEKYRGVIYENGTTTTYEHPGGTGTYFNDINDEGIIVGWYNTTERFYGLIYYETTEGTTTIPLNVPDSTSCTAEGISEDGKIVGWYTTGDEQLGFIYDMSDETYTTTNNFGSEYRPTDINTDGVYVGWQKNSMGYYSGFKSTSSNEIKMPGALNTSIEAINDDGSIAGFYSVNVDDTSYQYGFVVLADSSDVIKYQYDSDTVTTGIGGISSLGHVAGWYVAGGTRYGFIHDGTDADYTKISVDGENYTQMTGINQQGKAVGFTYSYETIVHEDDEFIEDLEDKLSCFINSLLN